MSAPTHAAYLDSESEDDFLRWVMEIAHTYDWLCVHYRPARVGKGAKTRIVTPLTGDKGAPDLILAKGGRVILAELKKRTGVPSAAQRAWLAALGPNGRLWRPADRAAILAELAAP